MQRSDQFHSEIFERLKRTLKARGITYKEFAVMLNTSEQSVKRLFRQQDCKFSRLIEICELLNISITDLIDVNAREKVVPTPLSRKVENAFYNDDALLSYFMLLIFGFSPSHIQQNFELTDSCTYQYLRDLEKLDILEIGKDNDYRFIISMPIMWDPKGMLRQKKIEINHKILDYGISNADKPLHQHLSGSYSIHPDSVEKITQEMKELYQRFTKLAHQDQLFYDKSQLQNFKWLSVFHPFPVTDVFKIPIYTKEKRTIHAI